ncbi:hypothetical protein U1Q18_007706 [Sarracenia purpurea var. burkii]
MVSISISRPLCYQICISFRLSVGVSPLVHLCALVPFGPVPWSGSWVRGIRIFSLWWIFSGDAQSFGLHDVQNFGVVVVAVQCLVMLCRVGYAGAELVGVDVQNFLKCVCAVFMLLMLVGFTLRPYCYSLGLPMDFGTWSSQFVYSPLSSIIST